MGLYRTVLRPLLFALPAETAHHGAIAAAALLGGMPLVRSAVRAATPAPDPKLALRVWGLPFTSPIGLAAGLDKNGVAVRGLETFRPSHIEVGTITAQAQPGNPKPRLFRLPADQAVINRMGFNNAGAAAAAARLELTVGKRGTQRSSILGINLGKTKAVPVDQALDDYRASVRLLAPLADYLVVNVSSPNTPGLRDLQGEALLRPLLTGVKEEVAAWAPGVPLLLKIAPDLAEAGIDAAVDVALETGCDGLICTNTTISRNGLGTPTDQVAALGAGGLSGAPLRQRATAVLGRVARRIHDSDRPVPVIGVGGVDSADAAWEKIGFGASLVQVYTGLIYQGPGLIAEIHRGLSERVEQAGLASITQAVGRLL
ncbi:dihydroorotate dehydrogenase [Planctomycetota bacterium]|nr:dihydroorotate dehydrogenase [Planctomycetota bacterium]